MTRKGAALKSLGKDPRYKTVSCSLRGVLSSGALFLLPRFEKYAQSNGIYSYLVSLAVNALLQTHDEWMASSGRLQLQQSETRRRKMCPSYENAIVHLSATRKRTANPATFRNHCRVAAKEFGTLRCELTHIGRSHIRWQADKALQRFMARVTNRMFRNESCRLHRHDVLPEARAELRQTLRASRSRAEKTVVFFGDGTFKSSMKGKQSVPKKKLLKVLAATGVTVLLGEYNTSKMCPCGTDELITPRSTTELQLRVHKTTGDKCSVLKVVDNRDEVSTVQFGQAALRCLAVWCWASASLSAV